MAVSQPEDHHVSQLRDRLKQQIDRIPDERLQSVADFVSYIEQLESQRATDELMQIPGFDDAMRRGLEDIEHGRTAGFRQVRDDV
jgi:hypothetical protein